MSHFSVAVLSDDPETLNFMLNPYQENTEDPAYLEFREADETKEELWEEYNKKQDGYESFADFLGDQYGYILHRRTGKIGYMHNPNAKWDWWQIGGRFRGMLKPKDKSRKIWDWNQAQLKDVDFSPDMEKHEKAKRFWEVVVEGGELKPGETESMFRTIWKPEYYTEQYGDKETYAQSVANFSTWALVTPDGEWHENGQMGWFGMSDSTHESRESYERMFAETMKMADPELWITIVDCHI